MPPLVEVRDLAKSFGSLRAVAGVSFSVEAGETFGLLGPNGAGKSTTLAMLTGLLRPDAGSIHIAGLPDPVRPAVRRSIGLAPQANALYGELTGEENLRFFGSLHGLSGAVLARNVDRALELVGLADRRRDRARTYSGGMARRLNLAAALVHEPRVVLLDEPTAGVDPQSRNHLLEQIERLRAAGLTIVYTTHYMEEAARLCQRVAIIDHGRLLALDSVPALIQAHGGLQRVDAELPPGASVPDLPLAPGEELLRDGSRLQIRTAEPQSVLRRLLAADLPLSAIRIERPSLESVFLSLTGRRLRDA